MYSPPRYQLNLPRRSIRLSEWKARGGIFPSDDGGFSVSADSVIDEPREPRLTPTGVLDSRGQMLVRVAIPIKVQMGFHSPVTNPEPDEVEAIIPEDMLSISDIGVGLSHIDESELGDEGYEDEETDGAPTGEQPAIRLSELIAEVQARGIVVVDDLAEDE